MSVESERFDPAQFMPPWIRHEHVERYVFAARHVRDRVVIDCACGAGEGTRLFAEAGARRIHAIDLSPDAAAATARRCADVPGIVTALAGSALQIPLPDATADVFISLETFEHLPDQEAFLKEAHRLLKPGGMLICSTPNRQVYNPGRSLQSKPWNRFHIREYDQAEFVGALREYFPDCTLYGQNPVRWWRARAMEALAKAIPGNVAVRINQALKLPRFLADSPTRHRVTEQRPDRAYEYSLAVCRRV